MKKLIVVVVALLLLTAATRAQGVSKGFNLYAGGGVTFGSAPQSFTDNHKEGYHLMGGLGLNLIPLIQFVGKVEYHSFQKDFDEFRTDILDLEGGTRKLLMFGVDARLGANVPTAPLTPYLFGGIGLAKISESDFTTSFTGVLDQPDATELYVNIGGGIDFKLLQVINAFIQAKYVNVMQDGENLVYIPITAGIKL